VICCTLFSLPAFIERLPLPYLQDIFIFNHQKPNTYEGHEEIDSAISTIVDIDRDLAIALLIEELHHPQRYDRAAEMMVDLAPIEAIEALFNLLQTGDRNQKFKNGQDYTIPILAIDLIRCSRHLQPDYDIFY
jgi:hypothetical protein